MTIGMYSNRVGWTQLATSDDPGLAQVVAQWFLDESDAAGPNSPKRIGEFERPLLEAMAGQADPSR